MLLIKYYKSKLHIFPRCKYLKDYEWHSII